MTLSIRPRTSEERLPLEGKLAQRQLRLMRSKLKIITMGWYDAVTFDLIRSGLSRTTFPSRGRLFSPRRVLRMKFVRAGHAAAPTRKIDTAYRPSSGHPKGWPPSPRGRLPSKGRHTFTTSNRSPPQSVLRTDSSPYTPGAFTLSIQVPTAPHPSALTGSHLPPGEGFSQSGRVPASNLGHSLRKHLGKNNRYKLTYIIPQPPGIFNMCSAGGPE